MLDPLILIDFYVLLLLWILDLPFSLVPQILLRVLVYLLNKLTNPPQIDCLVHRSENMEVSFVFSGCILLLACIYCPLGLCTIKFLDDFLFLLGFLIC